MTSLALHSVRFEARAMLRNPRARFFTVLLPVILLASLTAIYGSHDVSTNAGNIAPARFFLPAIISLAVVTSCFGALTQSVTTRRQLGVFKRRRAAPAPAWALVLAPSLATTAVAGGTAALMLVLGRVAWGVGLSAGALVGVVLTATVAAASFCAIAFALAGIVRSADAVQPVVQAILLPLYFISGVWFPADGLPHGLKAVADVFPIVHLTAPLHRAFAQDTLAAAVSPRDLAVLAAWGAIAGWVAVRRFSWLPSKDTV